MIEATRDALPQPVREAGYHSHGELSLYRGGHCDAHNQTMTLITQAKA